MKLIAIVVLYKCLPEDSPTLSSLADNYKAIAAHASEFEVIIYDNTPTPPDNSADSFSFPFTFQYVADTQNQGLAVAYNYALETAINRSAGWLLLLDQDSVLPPLFIQQLQQDIEKINHQNEIAAIAPKMYFKKTLFSPSRVFYGGIHRPLHAGISGECSDEICAVGSATALKVSFLQEINGFNPIFWLDCLDRWLYLMIYKKGYRVFVSDSRLEHNLSVLDYGSFINMQRYRNIIDAESVLISRYRSKGEHLVYLLRLLSRVITFLPDAEKRKYVLPTLRAVTRFLFTDQSRIARNS
jgi:GT2 family glycosyltransferase